MPFVGKDPGALRQCVTRVMPARGFRPRGGCRVHDRDAHYLAASSFFSSSWNSAYAFAPSTPFAFADLIHSCASGSVRLRTSAMKAGLASMICTLAAFSASRPPLSAASHDLPASRASASPDTDMIASWSCFGSLFHLSSFMKKPNDDE